MNVLKKFNQVFANNLSIAVALTALCALFFPAIFAPLSAYVSLLLQLIMFTMGLTMKPSDFQEVFKNPIDVVRIILLQYGIMPLVAYLVAKVFGLSGEVALGLIIVGSVSGGTSSNIMTLVANGKVPLSISATTVSTLVSPLLTPLLISFYGGAFIDIPFWPMYISIIQVVLVPVILGLVISYFFKSKTENVKVWMPSLSSIAVLMVLAGTVAINRDNLINGGWIVFMAVLTHHLLGYVISYGLFSLSFWRTNKATKRTIAIDVATKNTGLSASLGLAHFSVEAAMAGAAGTIVHTLTGMLFASLCAKKDRQASELRTSLVQQPQSNR